MTESIRLEKVNCPRCGQGESTIIYKGRDFLHGIPGEFYASECHHCQLWFQNPRPILSDIGRLYPGDYLPHVTADKQHALRPVAPAKKKFLREKFGYAHLQKNAGEPFDWRSLSVLNFAKGYVLNRELVPQFVPNGSLLEIGCASGARLIELRKLGWQNLHGIELVPEAVEKARAEGFLVECGMIEDTLQKYPDESFDVILTTMVVEHLFNPFEVFKMITQKLKPGGQLLFSTVVRDSIDVKPYGAYWSGFDFPRHMVYFRKKDLLFALQNDYQSVRWYHQSAPIDYVRSSTFKLAAKEGTIMDKVIVAMAESIVGRGISMALSTMGLTTRVSCSCVKKL